MMKCLCLNHKRRKQSDPWLAWFIFHKIYCMYSNINNIEKMNSQAFKNKKKQTISENNLKNHVIMMIKINPSCKKISFLLISMIPNQEPLRYLYVMKLGLIPMEYGTRLPVLTSYFKLKKSAKFKLDNEHHSSAHCLYLPDMMGNLS